ncbi:Carbonic anhydrase - like 5 [Theobroma cacao]|nr:Carbonic anhydrase - like 5 [Theobroma cacao]
MVAKIKGQHPRFLVFTCSDSRLRHTEIGSAIEYVVKALKVENILVIGHSRCGGIKRLMKLPDESYTYDFIDQWVQIGLLAKIKVLEEANHLPFEEQCRLCEKVKSQAAPTCFCHQIEQGYVPWQTI